MMSEKQIDERFNAYIEYVRIKLAIMKYYQLESLLWRLENEVDEDE